ncbi:MAG: hypothetical protein A2138_22185 [Deltaproteobacteria bacterium RBG_16_71_12]|nr:MAG: hypothetical protein A2138_22185 [Deltaproteobacteria bacterium RBG_16_71_12]
MSPKAATLCAAAFALLTSCNALFGYAPDQICETIIRAQCHFAFACCSAAERNAFATGLAGYRNEGNCVQQLLDDSGVCGNERVVHESVNQGRFSYDAALAERCLKPAIDAANSCDADALLGGGLSDEATECVNVNGFAFGVGLVAAGDPCFNSFECVDPGAVCELPQDDPDDNQVLVTRVGDCRAPANVGGDCSPDGSDGLCEPGSFCNAADVCEQVPPLSANGTGCNSDNDCASDFCDDVTDPVVPVCGDRFADGAACNSDNDCLSDICEPDDAGNDVCQSPPELIVEACNGLQGDDTQFE